MANPKQRLSATEARKRLTQAAINGDLDEIRRVLEVRGDAVHLRNSHHNTALRSAIGAGQVQAAELLVAHGADIYQVNHGGSSLMDVAAYTGLPAIVHWLGRAGLEIGLLERSAIGDFEGVLATLEVDPTQLMQRDYRGLTALHHAARCGHIEIIELLVDRGADLKVANRHGHVPLSVAVEECQLEAVICLLDKGADPNVRGGHYGGTVLHRAVLHRSLEIVVALLNAEADPNSTDANSKTPLHDAIGVGNQKLVDALLSSPRIDLTLRSGKTKFSEIGETPLEYARNRKKTRLVKTIEAYVNSH